jgi:predicted MFS family arabinose efflux permease
MGFLAGDGDDRVRIYAIAVLASLLVFGRLSDHIGRRPVLLVATAAQAFTMLLFATAGGVGDLIIARIIQGLITGAAVAAVGAGMIDIDRTRGTVANAVAPAFGTASGGMLAGVLVQYLPAPTHLVYAALAFVFLLQFAGVAMMSESISPQRGALASLKPQFRLPVLARQPFVIAMPVLIAAWSLAGFYGSLGPMLVRGMLGSTSALLGGLALFVLAGSAGIATLLLQHREPRTMMIVGASTLLLGVAVTIAALPYHSIAVFFIGTTIAGIGFGSGFQGAVRTVVPFAAAHERAGVLSLVFVVSYLAMGTPAVAAGYWVARHGNIIGAAQVFGLFVMLLAALALLGTALVARRKASV